MENIYLLMIVALAVLAIADLVVGVSNDAVNFLNSAIGSKAISFRTIMIIASLGIFFGAVFSSGMMEVARKGIFVPDQFAFSEIMIIFMAVMITDILLLDFFNTLGMPTSTTVSIVFELLGAAVAMALIKIGASQTETLADLGNYINSDKALVIISGILLSVVIAFTIGALVQFISRLVFSFQYEKKIKHFGAVFGGLALTAITYFIIMKGLKGTPYYDDIKTYLTGNELYILAGSFVIWTLFSQLYTSIFKKNILVFVIIMGTFGLALAFAGNDLVNFIGVPMAAYHSYEAWVASGVAPGEFSMGVLANKVPTEPLLLFIAGGVMVLTLWFSKKARSVTETELGLARQDEGREKFQPNLLSRSIVRLTTRVNDGLTAVLPASAKSHIAKQFTKVETKAISKEDAPVFDMIRASVNLMIAGVLISIATSMKLPLSTTYVTFMVAMGTSLADRAWGRESAVYRVAGVFNVIGGWFFTAFSAFIAAAIMASIIYLGGPAAIAILLFFAVVLLVRNYISYKKSNSLTKEEDSLKRAESSSIQGVIQESADNIAAVASRSNKILSDSINGLALEDLKLLKKSKKGTTKLTTEVEEMRDNIFYFIKNLDEASVGASNFYITALGYLQDMSQSLEFISKASYKHVNNNHRKLKFNQTRELLDLQSEMGTLFNQINVAFLNKDFGAIESFLKNKEQLMNKVSDKVQKQIARTRTEESSPKNTSLYFSILMETRDLTVAVMNLMELYANEYDSKIPVAEPAGTSN
ncbi:inorganic phosphate transporter [Robertkochia marina]|uniref:Phosphate transporter n=1 Tax=Robertkochia marina TaxID=1227945 RepID=A0A4S3M3V1_9FLAO|nr:inorganic phosphate transporter [Robertkochia marina]THD69445.1 inorganic phosphate transporter [Robertkochia marina]TRZ47294.1 inorganic phosphate transporter [Robertkochia marina]